MARHQFCRERGEAFDKPRWLLRAIEVAAAAVLDRRLPSRKNAKAWRGSQDEGRAASHPGHPPKTRRTLRAPAFALNSRARSHEGWPRTPHQIRPMNNLDISRSQPRDTKIRLYGADAFEGMRRAGQLASAGARHAGRARQAGRHHGAARRPGRGVRPQSRGHSRAAQLSRLSQGHLHLDQSCRLPRHPQRQAAEGRRHRQYRRDPDPRRLARRYQPHVRGRRTSRAGPSG